MYPSNRSVDVALPPYAALPAFSGTDLRHAWDVFGRDDRLGTLNHLTAARRRAALAAVRTGETVNLTLPLDQPDPPPFGRSPLRHHVYPANGFSWGDRIEELDMQSSTQWDGLLHVRHKEHGFYGGRDGTARANRTLGIDSWAQQGIVGRGVLLDVGRHLSRLDRGYDPLVGRAVTADELAQVAERQGTRIEPGDILCVRFGWYAQFCRLDGAMRSELSAQPTTAGLSARSETAAFLWDHQVAAVACDNPTVEVQPGNRDEGFLHHRLITMLGMPLGELFDFEVLAAACADSGRWDFLFVSVPLNLPGGVGSPANAIAVM